MEGLKTERAGTAVERPQTLTPASGVLAIAVAAAAARAPASAAAPADEAPLGLRGATAPPLVSVRPRDVMAGVTRAEAAPAQAIDRTAPTQAPALDGAFTSSAGAGLARRAIATAAAPHGAIAASP
jgi:hypothetical protein